MERLDNRSWPFAFKCQINGKKLSKLPSPKPVKLNHESWVDLSCANNKNSNKKELNYNIDMPVLGIAGCHRREIQHWNCSAGFCRYVTRRPWWYPGIIWGASLDGASYVLSIPLQQKSWRYKFYIYCDVSHTHLYIYVCVSSLFNWLLCIFRVIATFFWQTGITAKHSIKLL